MKNIILILSAGISINLICSVGSTQEICRNVFASACGPGIISDGTGVVASKPPETRSETDPLTPQTQTELRNYFANNRETLRRQAIEQFNLNCESGLTGVSVQSDICDAEIENKLVNLLQRRRASGTAGRYNLPELVFMEESGFLGLMNQVDFNGELQVDVSEQEQKVTRLFGQIKTAIINKINASNLSPEDKRIIANRISRVENRGSDCGATFTLNDNYLPKAYYTPIGNEFYLCRNLLSRANSEFALITVIAHEISHSIDPCMLRYAHPESYGNFYVSDFNEAEARFPYANLTSCLRSSNSIGAVNRAASEAAPNSGPVAVNYCDQSDQIGESVSDWFASEVMVEVMEQNHPNLTQEQWRNGIRNTYRAKCDQGHVSHNNGFDPHPSVEKRYNNILLANKAVREKMGCGRVSYNKVQCSIDEARGTSSRGSRSSRGESTGPSRRQNTETNVRTGR